MKIRYINTPNHLKMSVHEVLNVEITKTFIDQAKASGEEVLELEVIAHDETFILLNNGPYDFWICKLNNQWHRAYIGYDSKYINQVLNASDFREVRKVPIHYFDNQILPIFIKRKTLLS